MNLKLLVQTFLVVAILIITLPQNAHAYLDAGTGSILLQAVVGAGLAAAFTIRAYWQRLVCFFRKGDGKTKGEKQ